MDTSQWKITRKFRAGRTAILATAALLLAGGGLQAEGATLLVSTGGSDSGNCQVSACATVTYALTQAAATGDVISLGAGTFAENVVIGKSVVLAGAGQATTTLLPAVSGPTCGAAEPQPSLCAGGSVVLLVRANDVEIRDLTVDGDNPNLTSGEVFGGADLDARIGIVTDYVSGTFNGLSVHDVTVRNVYLRGLYAASGGTFAFTGNTVENVQASYYSIGIFNFGGSGTMSSNTVSACSDAIASNWSTGVQFLDNVISDSESAVHTDNAQGPTADLIDGNVASDLRVGTSYAFWVFAPAVAPAVTNNTVTGTTVGLGAFGTGTVSPAFEDNVVDCQGQAGSLGAWVSTTLFGWGSRNTGVSLAGNRISNCGTGIAIQAENAYTTTLAATGNAVLDNTTAGISLDGADPGTYTVSLDHNRIFGNGIGLTNPTGQAVNAAANWWGCNEGPGGTGALGACDTVNGTATFTPWLVLAVPVVTPATFDLAGGSATVATDLAHDSTSAVSAPGVPDGTPVDFTTSLPWATLTPTNVGSSSGAASSTLTSIAPGSGTVCVTVDNEQQCSDTVTVTGVPHQVPTLGLVGLALLGGLLALAGIPLLRR